MSATESRPPSPRPRAARPASPAGPVPCHDGPTDRIPVPATRAVRTTGPIPIDRPNPSLAGDLAALAFDPPALLLRAIPAQRTPDATGSAA